MCCVLLFYVSAVTAGSGVSPPNPAAAPLSAKPISSEIRLPVPDAETKAVARRDEIPAQLTRLEERVAALEQ